MFEELAKSITTGNITLSGVFLACLYGVRCWYQEFGKDIFRSHLAMVNTITTNSDIEVLYKKEISDTLKDMLQRQKEHFSTCQGNRKCEAS